MKTDIWRTLVNRSAVGLYLAQDGRIRLCNRVLERWLGFAAGELVDSDHLKIFHPEYRKQISRITRNLLGDEKRRRPSVTECQALKKKGGALWLLGQLTTVKFDGKPALLHSLIDISRWKQDMQKLQESEERFITLSEAAKDAIVMMDHRGRTSYWNPAATRMFGYRPEEILGKNTHRILAPAPLYRVYRQAFPRFQQTGRGKAVDRTLELTGKRKGGESFPIELSLSSININGSWHSLAIIRDITERKEREALLNRQEKELKDLVNKKTRSLQKEIRQRKTKELELQKSEEKYRTLFERVPLGIYRTTPDGRIIDANPALVKMLGFRNRQELIANRVSQYFADYRDRQRQQDLLKKRDILTNFEIRMRRQDGSTFWARDNARAITDPAGRVIFYEGILEDITDQKETEEKLRQISIRDPLTNIYNRRHIFDRLEELIQKHKRDQSLFAVAILDIDHFKQINDTHGHLAGDMILKDFADILRHSLRSYDLLGRFGGEEFIIVFIGSTKNQAAAIIRRILKDVRQKMFIYRDANIRFTFSGGIADVAGLSSRTLSGDRIIGLADQRLYAAKKGGRNCILLD